MDNLAYHHKWMSDYESNPQEVKKSMMSLISRRPFPGFEDLPSSLNLLDQMLDRLNTQPDNARPWGPAVDIVENDKELVLSADLPGVKLSDVEVKIEDGTLTLSGSRKFENEDNKNGYHRIERSYGQFRRAFALPDSVDPAKVEAAFDNGVLKVTLPKKEIARPRTVKVEIAAK
jgi:HSP20 family protein